MGNIDPEIEALAREIRPLIQPISYRVAIAIVSLMVGIAVITTLAIIWVIRPLICHPNPSEGPSGAPAGRRV